MGLTSSRYYHIKLLNPWELEYDIYIVGTVSKLTISEIQDYDIRSNFFTKYGLGIAHYVSIVKDSTPIYFGYAIKSKSPILLSDTDKIFIPESLIDFKCASTYEYLTGAIPFFKITCNTRYFKNPMDETTFENNTKKEIIDSLKDTENLIADSLNVEYTSTEALTTQDVVDTLSNSINIQLTENNQNRIQEKLITEAKVRELYEKRIEMENAKASYISSKNTYDNLIKKLANDQLAITEENLILDGVKEVFTAMCEKVKNGEMNPANFSTFQEMYESVKSSLK